MLGQRVILKGSEIGIVVKPENALPVPSGYVWVYSPSREYSACFAYTSVQPLPNGAL